MNNVGNNDENMVFDGHKLKDLIQAYKEQFHTLAKLNINKDEAKILINHIYNDKECRFYFPLADRFEKFKESVLLEVLIEDKVLMVAYLKEICSSGEQSEVDIKIKKT